MTTSFKLFSFVLFLVFSNTTTGSTSNSVSPFQEAIIGTWIMENGIEVSITPEGKCITTAKNDTIGSFVVLSKDSILIQVRGNEDKKLKVEFFKDYFFIYEDNQYAQSFLRKTEIATDSSLIAEKIQGEWQVAVFFDAHLKNTMSAYININCCFIGDTIRFFAEKEVANEWKFHITDNYINQEFFNHEGPRHYLRFEKDTLLIAGLGKLVRRTTALSKKPEVVVYSEKIPQLSFHEIMTSSKVSALLDSLQKTANGPAGLFQIDKQEVTFSAKDSAAVSTLLHSQHAEELLQKYKPYFKSKSSDTEHKKAIILVDTTVELSGNNITQIQVRKDFLCQGTALVFIHLNAEGANALTALTEKNINKQIAIIVNGRLTQAPEILEKITTGKIQIFSDLISHKNAGPTLLTFEDLKTVWPKYKKKYNIR